MSPLLVELEQQACALPPDERAHLAEVLLESLRESPLAAIEEEWGREIERRVGAFGRGEMQAITAEEVFSKT